VSVAAQSLTLSPPRRLYTGWRQPGEPFLGDVAGTTDGVTAYAYLQAVITNAALPLATAIYIW